MSDIQYRNVIDHRDGSFEHGHRESDDGTGWKPVPRSEFVKLAGSLWFGLPVLERLARLGITTTAERAAEFEQLTDSHPYEGWYYLTGVALAMQDEAVDERDEALKWIMGSLAAELNARNLGFERASTVLSARALGTFAAMLVNGSIDRNFAKQIFAELLALPTKPTEAISCPDCYGYGYREVEIGHNPECSVCFTSGEVWRVHDMRAVVAKIASDPRFKAVNDSEIDGVLDRIIADNPEQFEKAKANPRLIQWFVGQAMKATQGKAKPPVVTTKMQERLGISE